MGQHFFQKSWKLVIATVSEVDQYIPKKEGVIYIRDNTCSPLKKVWIFKRYNGLNINRPLSICPYYQSPPEL